MDTIRLAASMPDATPARLVASLSATWSNAIRGAPVVPVAPLLIANMSVDVPNGGLYHIGIERNGIIDERTRTTRRSFPVPGTPTSFFFIIFACTETAANVASFDAMRNLDPWVVFRIGDSDYTNSVSADINDRVLQIEARTQNSAAQRRFRAAVPCFEIPDDHDRTNNDPSVAANQAVNRAGRMRLANPAAGSATETDPFYFPAQIGRMAFATTDNRGASDPQDAALTPGKTQLGTTQKAWLKAQATRAGQQGLAFWWNSPTAWDTPEAALSDGWRKFPAERTDLADHFKAAGLAGRMMMGAGDRHCSYLDSATAPGRFDFATGGGMPIPQVGAAPLWRNARSPGGTYDQGPFVFLDRDYASMFAGIQVIDNGGPTLKVISTIYHVPDPTIPATTVLGSMTTTLTGLAA